jgi:hypothetical protein
MLLEQNHMVLPNCHGSILNKSIGQAQAWTEPRAITDMHAQKLFPELCILTLTRI